MVMSPDPAERWNNLGKDFLKDRNLVEAIACFEKMLSINPRLGDAWADLGLARYENGQLKESSEAWQKALEINAAQPQTRIRLAWLMATAPDATLRNGARAVALAEEEVTAAGRQDPMVLSTLAAAYAEDGRFGEAVATARQVLALAEAQRNNALATSLQQELELYEMGQPMRGPK